MGLAGAVGAVTSSAAAAADLLELCAESGDIVAEVLVEETEEMVEVTEEQDDTDVSELLPEFDSSCIVDQTRQTSIRLAKYLDVGRAAGMQCNAREKLGWCVRTSWLCSRVG